MAPLGSSSAEPAANERHVLTRLLTLYEQEHQLYNQVLELSRRQGEIVRHRAPFDQVRAVLQEKKNCLLTIDRLEDSEHECRRLWQEGRRHWSAEARARMRSLLQEIGNTIETILQYEEQNDQLLLDQMRS